jgi:hypothetical protein
MVHAAQVYLPGGNGSETLAESKTLDITVGCYTGDHLPDLLVQWSETIMTEINPTKQHDKNDADSLRLIGLFFIVFAVCVAVATLFTDSFRGRIVNLICTLLFTLIASFAIFRSRNIRRDMRRRETLDHPSGN